MDTCSYFIDGVALFGSYPTQMFVDHLEQVLGIHYLVDLTEEDDKHIIKYQATNRISYPIKDKDAPANIKTFSSFILQLLAIIEDKKKIYIHCRGGHGRSGLVVACLLKMYYKLTVDKALDLTHECHQNRQVMREKWRRIGSPQTDSQKKFVKQLFMPVCYNNYNKDNNYMSNFYTSAMTIEINTQMIRFLNVESCYQAFKKEADDEYVSVLANEINPKMARRIGYKQGDATWEHKRVDVMKHIIIEKFLQSADLRNRLLSTGLGEIIKISERTSFWNILHYNRTGRLLTQIRNELYLVEK